MACLASNMFYERCLLIMLMVTILKTTAIYAIGEVGTIASYELWLMLCYAKQAAAPALAAHKLKFPVWKKNSFLMNELPTLFQFCGVTKTSNPPSSMFQKVAFKTWKYGGNCCQYGKP